MVFMPHWPIKYNRHPERIDLGPMKKLMELLGNPHKRIKNIIHVAGTNGKGSSCAFLEAILREAGYKVHKYTSPHLLEFNERIKIAGSEISDEYLFEIIERIRKVTEENNLDNSFFEITTAAAFIAFAENEADFLVLETGMGGRLDASNIIENPIATLITPISFEHTEYLGPTLPIISREKAEIIKPNSPCIISAQVQDVYDILFEKCESVSSEAIAYSYDYTISKADSGFLFESKKLTHKFPMPSLLGDHQILNAAGAIATILELDHDISVESIEKGITNTFWIARLQKLKYKGLDIYIDGAHNESGAQALSIWIKDNFNEPIPLILGMTDNRNVDNFTKYFKEITNMIYTVKVTSEALSYNAEKLASMINGIDASPCDSLEEAIYEASKNSKHIVIAGSLFLSSDMLKLIR